MSYLLVATEDFSTANDPLSDSADWSQAGTGFFDSGKATGGAYEATNTDNDGSGAYWVSDSFADDQYAQGVVGGTPDGASNWAILLRCADADPEECLLALFLGGSDEVLCLYLDSDGNSTQVGVTTAMTGLPALGDILRAEVVGNTLTILFDFGEGMVEQGVFDVSASGITGGSPGLFLSDTGATGHTFDDWEAGNIVPPPPSADTYPLRTREHRTALVSRLIPHDSVGESKGLQFDNDPQFLSSNGPSSTAAWVWMTAAAGPDQHMIVVDQIAADADDGGIGLFFNFDGDLEYRIGRDTSDSQREAEDIAVSANVGRWIHVCGTWNGGGSAVFANAPQVYVDGVLTNDVISVGTGALVDAPGSHSVGGREATQNRGLGGYIAGVGRWNHELSADEVRALAEGMHPLDMHPEALLLCPDFATGENLAPRYMQNPTPNLWEWDDDGMWEPPPALRLPSSQQQILFGPEAAPSTSDAGVYPLRRIPWTEQHPEGIPLDFSNPILDGVLHCYIAGSGVDLVQQTPVELLNGAAVRGEERGLVLDTDGSNDVADLHTSVPLMTHIDDPYTVIWFGRNPDDNAGTLISQRDDTVRNFQMHVDGNGLVFGSGDAGSPSAEFGQDSANRINDGDWHIYGVTHAQNATTVQGWVDGDNFDSEPRPTSTDLTPVNTSVNARWQSYPTTGYQLNGQCIYAITWRRELSTAEMQSLVENPWQILVPRYAPLIMDTSPAVGPTQADVYPIRHTELITKPQIRPTVNWQHPLSQGLVFCAPMIGVGQIYSNTDDGEIGYDLVTQKMPTVEITGAGPNKIEDRSAEYLGISQIGAHTRLRGRALNIEPNIVQSIDDAGLDYGTNDDWQLQEVTVITACYAVAETSSGSRILSHARANSDNYGLAIINTQIRFRANATSLDITPSGGVTGKLWFIAGTNNPDGDKTIRAWRPGTGEVFIGTGAGQTISYADDRGMRVGYNEAGNARGFDGEIYFTYVWNRVLHEAEIDAIFENPWILLESPARPLLIGSPAEEDITGTLTQTLEDDTSVGTGELEVEGPLAETLGDATSVGTGELEVEGPLAETLANATSVGTGEIFFLGTLTEVLDLTTVVSSGELEVEGTLVETLGDTTSTITSELEVEGSLTESLDNATGSSDGEAEVQGTLTEILDDVTVVSAGVVGDVVSGTIVETLDNVTSAAEGLRHHLGTIAQTLESAISTASGELEVEGLLAETLGNATSVGTGELEAEGTLAETLGDTTSTFDAEIEVESTLAETLDDATSVANGVVGDIVNGTLEKTLDNVTISAEGLRHHTGTLTKILDDITAVGTGALETEGIVTETLDDVVSTANGKLSYEGSLTETLDDTTTISSGELEIESSLAETLGNTIPTSAGEIFYEGSLEETLNDIINVVTGEVSIQGFIAEFLDDTTLVGLGLVGNDLNGTLSEVLDDTTISAEGLRHHIGSVIETLDDTTTTSSGELEIESSLAETLGNTIPTSAGEISYEGSLAEILDDITNIATGELSLQSYIAEFLDDAISIASGELKNEGTLTEVLSDDTGLATGLIGEDATGTVNITLEDTVSTIVAESTISGTLEQILDTTIDAIFGELEITSILNQLLDDVVGAAEGGLPVSGSLNTVLDFTLINMSGLVISSDKIHGGFDAERQSIEIRFADNWSITPIRWPNVKFSSSGLSEYVIFNNTTEQADQMDMGTVKPSYRYNGEVSIRICVKPNTGTKRVLQLAGLVSDIWRNAGFNGIIFESVRVNSVGIVDGWYEIEVISPYYRGSYELRSTQ